MQKGQIGPSGRKFMKRTIRAPFLFLLLLSLLLPLIAAAELGTFTVGSPVYLNTGVARPVYQNADSASKVIRVLSPGEAIELLTLSEGWAEILVINEAGERLAGWTLPEGIR